MKYIVQTAMRLSERMTINKEYGFILYNDVHQGREEGFI